MYLYVNLWLFVFCYNIKIIKFISIYKNMFPSIFYTLYLSILYLKVYKYSFYDAIFGFFYLITYFGGNYNLRKMKKKNN